MEKNEMKEIVTEKIEKKKERLITAKKVLEKYGKDITGALGISSLVFYMANIDGVESGIGVKVALGTIFVGCTVADGYLGTKTALDLIDNKLETGFEEDKDYEMYKLETKEKTKVKRLTK